MPIFTGMTGLLKRTPERESVRVVRYKIATKLLGRAKAWLERAEPENHLRLLIEQVELNEGDHVVSVGCGLGYSTVLLLLVSCKIC